MSKSKYLKSLQNCKNSSEALNFLYLRSKKEKREISLGYICKRAGIPSTGYLSDVFKGKRRLNSKYTEGILKALRLKGQEKKFVDLLVAKDNSKSIEAINIYNEKIDATLRFPVILCPVC